MPPGACCGGGGSACHADAGGACTTVPGVGPSATVVCAVATAADELVMAEASSGVCWPGYGSLQSRAM